MKIMTTLVKKASLAFVLLALAVMPTVGSVASAQEATPTVVINTPVVQDDNNDDGFPWGLLGLLGLAGLAGLRPKEHTHTVDRTTDRTPNR